MTFVEAFRTYRFSILPTTVYRVMFISLAQTTDGFFTAEDGQRAFVPTLLPTKFTPTTLVAGDDGEICMGAVSNALARIERNTWENINES